MDQEIISQFYRIRPILGRLAARYRVEIDPDDLLGRVWERRHLFNPEKGGLGTWILVVCKNQLINLARRKKTLPLAFEPAGREPAEPVESVNLDCLTPDERAVIVAVYLEGRKYREAAAQLGIPEGTVASRAGRALEKLRGAA